MTELLDEKAVLLANMHAGANIYLASLEAPRIAKSALPGQFIHMKIADMDDHILRRPFGVYDAQPEEGTIEIMYQVLGVGTRRLTALKPGVEMSLIGPIGRGWQPPEGIGRALLVAGGVGSAPLHPLAKMLVERDCQVTAVLGAQTKDALVARVRYADTVGSEPLCSTDDGTFGREGFCTSIVKDMLEAVDYDYVACCGPEPLMVKVASMAAEHGVFCEVSLEKRMACGVGACLSCVADTTEGRKRVCVDGPVFPAETVLW